MFLGRNIFPNEGDGLLSLVVTKDDGVGKREFRLDLYITKTGKKVPTYYTQTVEPLVGEQMHRCWTAVIRRAVYPTNADSAVVPAPEWYRCFNEKGGYRTAVMPSFANPNGELAALGWTTLWAFRWLRSNGTDSDAEHRFRDALHKFDKLMQNP